MNKPMLLLASFSIASIVTSACDIETHEGMEMDSKSDPECAAFCVHLYDCGSLSNQGIGDCLDVCSARMSLDWNTTASGCQCVVDDACRPISEYQCPGAPFPHEGPSGSGGSGTGGTSFGGASNAGGSGATAGTSSSAGASGATSGGGGTSANACTVDPDCPSGEDCVNGECRTRCNASCECPIGSSCVASYCEAAPPPTTCTTDCDCPAGDHCVSGVCG
jgi:hypothetical protein